MSDRRRLPDTDPFRPLPTAEPLTISPSEIDWSVALPSLLNHGLYRTSLAGNRIEIRPSGNGLVASVTFFTGVGGEAGLLETGETGGVWRLGLAGPDGGSGAAFYVARDDGVGVLGTNNPSGHHQVEIDGTEVARITADAGHNLQGLAWTDWTPTLTNLNVGSSGVVVAKYVQIGDTVHAHFRATLGGTGISVGDVRVSLPVEMGAALNLEPLGPCLLRDTGTATVGGVIEVVNTTSVVFREYNVSGSLLVTAALSSTSPFTWAAGDILAFNVTYEAV